MTGMFRGWIRTVGATMTALALVTTACGPNPPAPTRAPSSSGGQRPPECAGYEVYGDLSGRSISVYTPIVSPEDQSHVDSFRIFETCTGAKVNYEGSREFETQLPIKIEAGSPPDIAYLPQPGLLRDLIHRFPGKVVEVPQQALSDVTENYPSSWREHGSVDGKLYAVPVGASVKSLVWYSPKAFLSNGYQVPTTWDEMTALTERIAAEHPQARPWCAGLESGSSSGWPATDWLEDVMLRTVTPEEYDAWVAHEMPFNDPRAVTALDTVGSILRNKAYVNGGHGNVRSIASVPFSEAGLPILEGNCFLHHQASFYQANWPSETRIAEDGDVFAFHLPGMGATSSPLLVGGEFAAAFSDRPEVQAFQTWLASAEWTNEKARNTPGGWVSANKHLASENLNSPIDRLALQLLRDEDIVVRFDGSDLMPGSVGADTFPKGLSNWITLDLPSSEVLSEIEATWPKP